MAQATPQPVVTPDPENAEVQHQTSSTVLTDTEPEELVAPPLVEVGHELGKLANAYGVATEY